MKKDFVFYFNGSLLDYEEKIHIKDKFSDTGAVNIVAFPLRQMLKKKLNQILTHIHHYPLFLI
jgi:hypothetical protein